MILLGACAQSSPVTPDSGTAADLGMVPRELPPPIDACRARIPTDGFGTNVGRSFPGFELHACDGTPYDFYGDEFCDASLTVVLIAAGWCAPSIAVASDLESMINEPFRSRGVRMIEILTQTAEHTAPDQAYCEAWVDRFGLSNVELVDPAQRSAILFPRDVYPDLVIVDREGTIRARLSGADATRLAQTLRSLLPDD